MPSSWSIKPEDSFQIGVLDCQSSFTLRGHLISSQMQNYLCSGCSGWKSYSALWKGDPASQQYWNREVLFFFYLIVLSPEKVALLRRNILYFIIFPQRLCSKVRNTFLLCEFGKGKKSYKNRRRREHYFVTNSFDFLDLLAGRHDVRKWCKNKDRTQMW